MSQAWTNSIKAKTGNGGANLLPKTELGCRTKPVHGASSSSLIGTSRNSVQRRVGQLRRKVSRELIDHLAHAKSAGQCLSLLLRGPLGTNPPFALGYAGRRLAIESAASMARKMGTGRAAFARTPLGIFGNGFQSAGISCSTALLWKRFSVDVLSGLRKCITKTETGPIIGRKTLNYGSNGNLEANGLKISWSTPAGYFLATAIRPSGIFTLA